MTSASLLAEEGQPPSTETLDALWQEDPQIYRILKESGTPEGARQKLYGYLKELEWHFRNGDSDGHPLEQATAMEALRVFYNLLSPRNEKLAGFSLRGESRL